MYGKGIPRGKLEKEFEKTLNSVQPTRELGALATAMFDHIWERLSDQASEMTDVLKKKMLNLEKNIDQTVERAVSANNPRVIAAYEKNIEALEREKLLIAEKLKNPGRTKYTFDELFEHSMRFLASPCKLWDTGRLDLRKIVLKLVFTEHLHYHPKTGFLNTKLSMPFNVLGGELGLVQSDGAQGRTGILSL